MPKKSSIPWILASGNPGKLREFDALLSASGVEMIAQSRFNVPEPDETGLSFVENAIIKARNAAQYTGLPALADDSGIEVDALYGKPGIYSARFAGPEATDHDNNQKLLEELKLIPDAQRTARYHCAIVMLRYAEDPVPLICQASWEGVIAQMPQGENGFGYDPLFYIPALGCTAAQLDPIIKNQISHRAKALHQLSSMLINHSVLKKPDTL